MGITCSRLVDAHQAEVFGWHERPGAIVRLTALASLLTTGGHRVVRLVRRPPRRPDERQWDPSDPDPAMLEGTDAVVHLAGASIGGRFTASHKQAVRQSRVPPTEKLARRVGRAQGEPNVFVVASAVGFYDPERGPAVVDESSRRGPGFLADVVVDWEQAALAAEEAGARVVMVRTGLVQSARGGVLALLRPLFEAGLGGRLGSGRQWLSWVDLDDLADIYYRAIVDQDLSGPLVATAPNPVTNREYTATLARVLRRPARLPVPESARGYCSGQTGRTNSPLPARGRSRRTCCGRAASSGAATRGLPSPPVRSLPGKTGLLIAVCRLPSAV